MTETFTHWFPPAPEGGGRCCSVGVWLQKHRGRIFTAALATSGKEWEGQWMLQELTADLIKNSVCCLLCPACWRRRKCALTCKQFHIQAFSGVKFIRHSDISAQRVELFVITLLLCPSWVFLCLWDQRCLKISYKLTWAFFLISQSAFLISFVCDRGCMSEFSR